MEMSVRRKYSTIITTFFLFMSYAAAQQLYTFQQGLDATISFHHELETVDMLYTVQISTTSAENPFYMNGHLVQSNLEPDQVERFAVLVYQIGRKVTIDVQIAQIKSTDSDTFTVNLIESTTRLNHGHDGSRLYFAYVDVINSSGILECNILRSVDGGLWYEVQCITEVCNANGNREGTLVCYRQTNETLISVKHEGDLMTAVFLLSPSTPVSCCLYGSYDREPPCSCVELFAGVTTVSSTTHGGLIISPSSPTGSLSCGNKGALVTAGLLSCIFLVATVLLLIYMIKKYPTCRDSSTQTSKKIKVKGSDYQVNERPTRFMPSISSLLLNMRPMSSSQVELMIREDTQPGDEQDHNRSQIRSITQCTYHRAEKVQTSTLPDLLFTESSRPDTSWSSPF